MSWALNSYTLSALRRGAAIINFGRGLLIDTEALTVALDAGQMSHAVLDVFDIEPLPVQSTLWTHPDVTVLPHISAQTNINTASKIVADNVNRWFESGAMPDFVNRNKGY